MARPKKKGLVLRHYDASQKHLEFSERPLSEGISLRIRASSVEHSWCKIVVGKKRWGKLREVEAFPITVNVEPSKEHLDVTGSDVMNKKDILENL